MSILPRPEDFPCLARDKIRYGDTDCLGHVNNAVFSTFLETGRVELAFNPANPVARAGATFVLARLAMDFRAEMKWPGEVVIATGVEAVGSSSVRLKQALFQNGTCTATAETVLVHMDETTRRATPLSEKARAFFTRYILAGS